MSVERMLSLHLVRLEEKLQSRESVPPKQAGDSFTASPKDWEIAMTEPKPLLGTSELRGRLCMYVLRQGLAT